MNLPSQGQVLSVTRHVATFAAGAIAMFGLSTKIDPATVAAIINSAGTLVNDAVVLIGLVTPLVSGYLAAKSASLPSQLKAITTNPDVKIEGKIVTTPEVASAVPSNQVVADHP